jgi:hypothetical protein
MRLPIYILLMSLVTIATGYAQGNNPSGAALSPAEQATNMLLNQAQTREKDLATAAFGLKERADSLQKQIDDLKKQLADATAGKGDPASPAK